MKELHEMTAQALRKMIDQRRISVEELTRHYLARIEKYDARLNAVAEIDEGVLDQARRMDEQYKDLPLFGLAVLIKDNIDVKGLHTTAGSLALKDNIAQADAPIVANLRRMGALILGKTHMTEFANYTSGPMPNGYSSAGGQVYNAYSREADPSGSSTGSAVAVSAGFCAMAVGTDTSFSVVGCATANGVTGLKPPHGALCGEGIVPISHTLDSAGALTKDMEDALMLYGGMMGQEICTNPASVGEMRIAVNRFNREMVSDRQMGFYEALLGRLRKEGARILETEHPRNRHMGSIMRCEFAHDLEEYLAGSSAGIQTLDEIIAVYRNNPDTMMKHGIDTLEAAQASGGLKDAEYIEAMAERERVRAELMQELEEYDVCIMTGPTSVMHFAGLPSVALPMCMAEDGTPRGIILYGADEKKLYAAAMAIEKHCAGVTAPRL